MLALELINYDIPNLKPHDTVGFSLELMLEYKCSSLAVVEGKKYLGSLEEDFLMNFDENTILNTLPFKNPDYFIGDDLSILQAVDFLLEKELSLVPVVDKSLEVIGILYSSEAFKSMASLIYGGKGSVVMLNLGSKDYSLSEISRIIENEGHTIQKLIVTNFSESQSDELSILVKFTKEDVSAAISSLKRFGYQTHSFQPSLEINDMERDRYEMLMKYLSV